MAIDKNRHDSITAFASQKNVFVNRAKSVNSVKVICEVIGLGPKLSIGMSLNYDFFAKKTLISSIALKTCSFTFNRDSNDDYHLFALLTGLVLFIQIFGLKIDHCLLIFQ